ncbi:hypothetical protein TELCIR_02695 [Teladorsagia circumcincta]|uniref:Uncharacterized protein n=1 Tax=Teladorsagia circumcincta TaxID=45464 RepID=A0A2G9UYE8_TELCI|nr:hypothetical protein TELCIR_02695 [Teladorsagia circumcincta]
MVKFDSNNGVVEEVATIGSGDVATCQVPKHKSDSVIVRLRNRLHRKILSTFRLSAKSKESQPVETPSIIPQVLFAPPVQSSLEKPSRNASRMCSLRSILEHSALTAPTSRLITPPPSTEYDLSSVDEPKTSGTTSSAESILSWDRAIRRDHEEDASSLSICSENSLAESSFLSECSYRLDHTASLYRPMSAPLLNCLEEDIVYVDENLRQKRAITPIERRELNHFMFRTKSH